MKRKVIASVLGLVGACAMVATSYGQGSVVFANYTAPSGPPADAGVNAPVTFATSGTGGGLAGVAGNPVGQELTAALMFSLDGGATYSLLTTAQAGDSGYPTAFLGQAATATGLFQGPSVIIPGYSSGPISFIVQAYHGSSYAAASAANDWHGQSASFTLAGIATGQTPPGDFGQVGGGGFLHAFTVAVPEPSIFALAGLGAAGLMAFRRKK